MPVVTGCESVHQALFCGEQTRKGVAMPQIKDDIRNFREQRQDTIDKIRKGEELLNMQHVTLDDMDNDHLKSYLKQLRAKYNKSKGSVADKSLAPDEPQATSPDQEKEAQNQDQHEIGNGKLTENSLEEPEDWQRPLCEIEPPPKWLASRLDKEHPNWRNLSEAGLCACYQIAHRSHREEKYRALGYWLGFCSGP